MDWNLITYGLLADPTILLQVRMMHLFSYGKLQPAHRLEDDLIYEDEDSPV